MVPSTGLPLVAIPVKPFSVAKQRLAGRLDEEQRRALGMELARRTALAAIGAGASPLILSADDQVSEWAAAQSYDVIFDEGSSLDVAAHSATLFANDQPWIVSHADLPLLSSTDVELALSEMRKARWVIAPSSDGGTSLLGGLGVFDFSYGPGSFGRHLRMISEHEVSVLTRVGLMLDLDTPDDLDAALSHPRGAWLEAILE